MRFVSRFFQKLIAPVPVSALQKVLPEMTRGEAAGVMLTYGTLGQYEDYRSGLATVAAFHIEAGSRRFADFSWRMVTDIGEQISPYLEYLYARGMAELVIAINHGILSDDDVNEFYARGFESHGPSRREKIVERLKRRIKTGGTVADLNRYVQHLQLLAIENGVTDLNQAIDEVHGQVRTLVPDLGRLETRDAMSGHRPLRKYCRASGRDAPPDFDARRPPLPS